MHDNTPEAFIPEGSFKCIVVEHLDELAANNDKEERMERGTEWPHSDHAMPECQSQKKKQWRKGEMARMTGLGDEKNIIM